MQAGKGKLPFLVWTGKPAAFSLLSIRYAGKQAIAVLWLQLSHPQMTDVRGERNGRRIDEPPKYKAWLGNSLP